jgi:hypothetical protein
VTCIVHFQEMPAALQSQLADDQPATAAVQEVKALFEESKTLAGKASDRRGEQGNERQTTCARP